MRVPFFDCRSRIDSCFVEHRLAAAAVNLHVFCRSKTSALTPPLQAEPRSREAIASRHTDTAGRVGCETWRGQHAGSAMRRRLQVVLTSCLPHACLAPGLFALLLQGANSHGSGSPGLGSAGGCGQLAASHPGPRTAALRPASCARSCRLAGPGCILCGSAAWSGRTCYLSVGFDVSLALRCAAGALSAQLLVAVGWCLRRTLLRHTLCRQCKATCTPACSVLCGILLGLLPVCATHSL